MAVVRVAKDVEDYGVASGDPLAVGDVQNEVVGPVDQVRQDQNRFCVRVQQRDLWSRDNHMILTLHHSIYTTRETCEFMVT